MKQEGFFSARARRVPRRNLALAMQQFALLFSASVQVVDSLELLAEGESNLTLRESLFDLARRVSQGHTLSEAMGRHEDVFPRVLRAQVVLAEESGSLDLALAAAAEELEAETRLQQRLTSALSYPLFAASLAFVFLVFILLYFVPKMLELLAGLKLAMPWILRVLVLLTEHLTNPYVLFAILQIALVSVALFRLWINGEVGGAKFDQMLLGLPIFGTLIRKVASVRLARGMATLLECGSPIVQSLNSLSQGFANAELRRELREVRRGIEGGQTLSESLSSFTDYDQTLISLTQCGESSGKLSHCLKQAAKIEKEDLETLLERCVILLEPLLLMFLGAVVAFVTLLFFLPMKELVLSL